MRSDLYQLAASIGMIRPKINQEADLTAAKQYFRGIEKSEKAFHIEASFVKHDSIFDTRFIKNLVDYSNVYKNKSEDSPIAYPKLWEQGSKPNSNSWAQSVLEFSGATEKQSDFSGLDASNHLRIDQKYFHACCDK